MDLTQPLQGCVTPDSMDLSSAATYNASTIPTPATSPQSLKRSLEDSSTSPQSTDQSPCPDSKRQRRSQSKIFTPPASPRIQALPLRITIPYEEPTKAERRTIQLRKGYAERWKPKLQRPFPGRTEIRGAYRYKLMRHYIAPLAIPEANFVKPHIDLSPRVDKLRKAFPVLDTSFSGTAVKAKANKGCSLLSSFSAEWQLKRNKLITKSKGVRRSAWQNFSSGEKDRVDRGREAMMVSGLFDEDLAKEYTGEPNNLPDWKKKHTSVFAKRSRGKGCKGKESASG